jgi:hypothetical protein
VVVAQPENHFQTYATGYNGAFSGELRAPADRNVPMKRDKRKIIARRCALELPMGGVVNLGICMPEGVASVAEERSFSGLEILPAVIENNTARRDQSFFIYEAADGLFGTLEYATDLFDASTVERMIKEFRDVLYQIIADPGCGIAAPGARNTGNAGSDPAAEVQFH